DARSARSRLSRQTAKGAAPGRRGRPGCSTWTAARTVATGSTAHSSRAAPRSSSRNGRTRAPAGWRPRPSIARSAGRDDRAAAVGLQAHLLGDPVGLGDERLDDLVLRYGLEDLTLDEDLALAVARGDAEVGLAGLARAVDDAAHDGDAQRDGHALEARGDVVGELVDVHLGAPARGAGDDLELARPQVEGLEDLVADLDLLDRRRGQRDADRVADALGEQRAERGRGLDRPLEGGAGLGDAEVQGPVAPLGEHLVRLHHDDGVVVLDRDLEVVEAVLLEEGRLPHRGLDERLGGGLAV